MSESDFEWLLQCPCGASLSGDSEDAIVAESFAHLRDQHPEMADSYEREHILLMAIKLKRT